MTTNTIAGHDTFQVRAASPLEVTVIPGDSGAAALYVLDSAFLLDVTRGVQSLLTTLAGLVGEPLARLTLVGVGYPTADPQELFALRARDLTPSAGDDNGAIPIPPLDFGGAGPFLATLVEEVVPAVESHHPVAPDRRGLAGFSFGGLFALYTLLHRPQSFTDYLVGSPSLWWDQGLPFRWEADWAATHGDLDARVFTWVGAEEQSPVVSWKNERFPADALREMAQVDRFRAFVEALGARRYPNLQLASAVIDGEHHLTAPAAGLSRGLQHLAESTR